PFLPLAILANPVVRMGTLAASSAMAVSIGLTVYLPLYYENVFCLLAADSGLALVPLAVMTTPGSIISGRVMMYCDRYKWFPLIGLSCAAVTLTAIAVLPGLPLWLVIIALCVFGTGVGTVFSCTTVCIQNAV